MTSQASVPTASSASKDYVKKLQSDIQQGIDWLAELVKTSPSDNSRLNQLLGRKYNHLTQLLEKQQALMIIINDSFTTTNTLGSETAQELPEQQQKLLNLFTKSFSLTTKLGQEALDELQSKKSDLEIKEVEEQEQQQSNTAEQLKPESGTLYDPERRLLEYDDTQQDSGGDFANYASSSDTSSDRIRDKMAAHRSLLFKRSKDVQDVLEHFKEQMSPEMKDKVDKLQTVIEWMRGYDHMDVGQAEKIAMGDGSVSVET